MFPSTEQSLYDFQTPEPLVILTRKLSYLIQMTALTARTFFAFGR